MRAYVKRRVLARGVLSTLACVSGAGFVAGFEAVSGHHPAHQEFLYEPRTTRSAAFTFDVQMPASALGPGLKPTDFETNSTDAGTTYAVIEARYMSQQTSSSATAPASITLLFDQSGSILSSDPQDMRLRAGTQFLDAIPADTRVSAIAYGSSYTQVSSFDTDKVATKQAILNLRGNLMGGTQTFGTLHEVVQAMQNEPGNGNRLIFCFTDGSADDYFIAPQVAEEAKQAGIRVYFVALGNADFSVCASTARTTGGALLQVSDADKLAAAFNRLANKVVRRGGSVYKLTLRATRHGGTFAHGQTLAPMLAPVSGKLPARTYQVKAP